MIKICCPIIRANREMAQSAPPPTHNWEVFKPKMVKGWAKIVKTFWVPVYPSSLDPFYTVS